jgi:uncharacterized membrane protein YeaQ/YmgE (transglycosylase-associated protein family)
MEEQQIGWIAAIIVGGIAGWLAEQFMKSEMGLVMNIVLGIIGAAVASWLMGFLGISLGGGWIGYLMRRRSGKKYRAHLAEVPLTFRNNFAVCSFCAKT